METIINGLRIRVEKLDTLRMVHINDTSIPYYMRWNSRMYIWQFVEKQLQHNIKILESDISNFIIKSEKQR